MQSHCEPRVKKRMTCTLNLDARHHIGMILNLSPKGMFVQTTLPAEPGTLVDIGFRDPSRGDDIAVQAAVVWRRRVSPRMTGLNQSGMGMRILMNTPEYEAFMSGMLIDATGEDLGDRVARVSTNATPAAEEADEALPRFIVRLAQEGGPRSRRAVVHSADARSARAAALEQVGDGWTILEVVEK